MIHPSQVAAAVADRAPGFKPKVGLILGSGLGALADSMQDAIRIPYVELPGFPISTIPGHAGRLVLGKLGGLEVACLQGRVHVYEGASGKDFKTLIRALHSIGCEILLITNAAGSLRFDVEPGQLMLINDHINFHPGNPLIGPNDEEFGPRFFAMDDAYDKQLRERFHTTARQLKIALSEGVYIGTLGPNFETPAEIRAFRIWGADAVGMSTVPEVIMARHCGMRVAAVSAITNFAAGMSQKEITHEQTLHYGKLAATDLSRLLIAFMENLQHDFTTGSD